MKIILEYMFCVAEIKKICQTIQRYGEILFGFQFVDLSWHHYVNSSHAGFKIGLSMLRPN